MNIKRFLAIAFALVLLFALASCNKCKNHVDANDDLKCDNCGADYDDGEEAPDVVTVKVKFTVRFDSGEPVSGLKLMLDRKETTYYTITLDDNGQAYVDIVPATYYFSLEGYYLVDSVNGQNVSGAVIKENTTEINIVFKDNTPDGSAEKPFFISDAENTVVLAPGQEIFYTCHVPSEKYIRVDNENITVTYENQSYNPVNGSVEVLLEAAGREQAVFSLKNNSDSEITTVIHLGASLGTSENPITLTENNLSVTVTTGKVIYYTWVAYKDGVLLLESPTERNNISLKNLSVGNSSEENPSTLESGVAYMVVSKGDIISIAVSVVPEAPDAQPTQIALALSLTIYEGTDSDPVPVLKDKISLTLGAKTEIAFTGKIGETLRISDESYVSVSHNTITYTNEGRDLEMPIVKPLFVLQNVTDNSNSITMIFDSE